MAWLCTRPSGASPALFAVLFIGAWFQAALCSEFTVTRAYGLCGTTPETPGQGWASTIAPPELRQTLSPALFSIERSLQDPIVTKAIETFVRQRAAYLAADPSSQLEAIFQALAIGGKHNYIEYERVRLRTWSVDGSPTKASGPLGHRYYLHLKAVVDKSTGAAQKHEGVVFVNEERRAFVTQHTSAPCVVQMREIPSLIGGGYHLDRAQTDIEVTTGPEGLNLTALASASAAQDGAGEDSTHRLNVVSYNMWNLELPYDPRMRAMLRQLEESQADFVGLQEVRYSNFEYPETHLFGDGYGLQLSEVAHHRSLAEFSNFVWLPAMTYLSQPDLDGSIVRGLQHTDEGVAFMSRWPISQVRYHPITRDYQDEIDAHQRVLLEARMDNVPGFGKIAAFVTHLTLSANARKRTAIEIGQAISAARSSGYRVILMGDFNAEPETELVRFLRGEVSIYGTKLHNLGDVMLMRNGNVSEDDAWTFTTLHEAPKRRIDYLLVDTDPALPRWSVTQAGAVSVKGLEIEGKKGKKVFPSDHRALLAKISAAKT